MVRLHVLVIASVLALAGCKTAPSITTKTEPVAVPLIYSPLPPVVDRPPLPHIIITPESDKVDGEVVKSYAASVQTLIDYARQLEVIVANYKDINEAYAVVRAKIIADWKAQTGKDLTVADPTLPATQP